jgi:hypothetical protein
MIRTIVTSDKNRLTLQLPNSMVGKTIEVIAFEIDEVMPEYDLVAPPASIKIETINNALRKHRVDLSNFKFDRDEANDYE